MNVCVCVCVHVCKYVYKCAWVSTYTMWLHIHVFVCLQIRVCKYLLKRGSLRTLLGYVVRKFIFSDFDSGSALNCSSNSPVKIKQTMKKRESQSASQSVSQSVGWSGRDVFRFICHSMCTFVSAYTYLSFLYPS